jgi:nucleobase transporter 1/2
MLATSVVMMVFGVLGKVGAIFVAIPEPIIGGVFISLFGELAIFVL